jgi:methionyl-tRNA formyltransferase
MRIAFFGSGSPISTAAFDAVAARATIVATIVPADRPRGGLRGLLRRALRRRATGPLARRARAVGAPVVEHARGRGEPLAGVLAAARPDLICVATYPWLLPPAVLEAAPLGALGIHPSLLPRRRGPDPLFWSFLDGDAETGVTVFRLDAREDAGPIVAQEAIPLARGIPGREAYEAIARRGAALLAQAVDDASGTLAGRSQDEALATRQPDPRTAAPHLALDEVDAERLWHAARGIGPGRLVVRAKGGATLVVGAAIGHGGNGSGTPGAAERVRGGWRLHCLQGWVDVAR